MLRDLLVHVSGEYGRQRLGFATELAMQTGARLTGLHVIPPAEISPRYKPSQVASAVTRFAAALTADADAGKASFEEMTANRLSDARWIEAKGDVAQGICIRARLADLVIVGRDEWQDPPETHPFPIAHSGVLQCGRPVMVVPDGTLSPVFTKVGVAWDGSREAVRAVHDAIPMLKSAKSVDLISVIKPTESSSDVNINDLAAHLTHHGISIKAKVECGVGSQEHNRLQRIID